MKKAFAVFTLLACLTSLSGSAQSGVSNNNFVLWLHSLITFKKTQHRVALSPATTYQKSWRDDNWNGLAWDEVNRNQRSSLYNEAHDFAAWCTPQPTQKMPFDFGISAVLGAGALAAARTARSRRKKAQTVA